MKVCEVCGCEYREDFSCQVISNGNTLFVCPRCCEKKEENKSDETA